VSNLLPLLVVSSILTMKFWDEERIEDVNQAVSEVSSLPVGVLNKMELDMLKTLDYQLFINEATINKFKEGAKNKRIGAIIRSDGLVVVRKRMRLMDDIHYYKQYHSNNTNKRVKICE